jgi:DNA-binding response OmpR family regulator
VTPGGAASVLVVDDDDDLADVLGRALDRQGWVVHRARTGSDAIASLPSLGVLDAAVVDLVLPGAGGLDVVRSIRRAFPRCRIVALTGLAEPMMQSAFSDAGADVFLAKPVELAHLFEALTARR